MRDRFDDEARALLGLVEAGEREFALTGSYAGHDRARDAIATALREKTVDGWAIGDSCEVQLGGTAWHAGKIVAIGRDFVGGYVRVHVPSEDMVVPRKSTHDEALRRSSAEATPAPPASSARPSRRG